MDIRIVNRSIYKYKYLSESLKVHIREESDGKIDFVWRVKDICDIEDSFVLKKDKTEKYYFNFITKILINKNNIFI